MYGNRMSELLRQVRIIHKTKANRWRYSFTFFTIAFLAGTKYLLANRVIKIAFEDLGCAQSAAEGAFSSTYKYQASKIPDKRADGKINWTVGQSLADSQNWSRFLMNTPANLMTPSILSNNVKQLFAGRIPRQKMGRGFENELVLIGVTGKR